MMPIMSWDELAVAVRARRRELGLTQADVAAAGHVSVELIRNIETKRRTPERLNPRKARGLEDALRWESGSIDAVLAGGVATTAEPKPPPTPKSPPPTRATASPWQGKSWPCGPLCRRTSARSAQMRARR